MILILYVLASFGAAFALGYSKISLPIRNYLNHISSLDWIALDRSPPANLADSKHIVAVPKIVKFASIWLLSLLECPACLSFWFGIAASFTPIADTLPISAPFSLILPLLGFANMGAVLALGMLTGLIKTE